jgi:hypothetical protein
MMSYDKFADLRTRRNTIRRYRRLLETELTDIERQYVERRLAEERSAFEKLTASTFPLTFSIPHDPVAPPRATAQP